MKKQIIILSGIFIALGFLYAVSKYATHLEGDGQALFGTGNKSGSASLIDLSNPRILLGSVQNVFAARIISEIGSSPRPSNPEMPRVQYVADVIYNIKGVAENKIMIDLSLLGGGKGLVPGATYLFAARHWDEPSYFVGPQEETMTLIAIDSAMTTEQLLQVALRHPRTYDLLNAYPNEILSEADLSHNATRNSFQSLSDEEKQTIYAKFQRLVPPRPVPGWLPPPPKRIDTTENECFDGLDDDKDGITDRYDPDCLVFYREDRSAFCLDNKDNDLDNLTDVADPDCAQFYPAPTPSTPPPPPAPPQPIHVTSTSPASSTGQ